MSILTVRQRSGWLVAGFNVGRLTDSVTVQQAAGELFAALEAVPLRGNVAICFEGVDQASTLVAGMLRAARAMIVDDRFGRVVLCRVGHSVRELVRLTGLEDAFEQFARLRDVLAETSATPKRAYAHASSRSPSYGSDTEWID